MEGRKVKVRTSIFEREPIAPVNGTPVMTNFELTRDLLVHCFVLRLRRLNLSKRMVIISERLLFGGKFITSDIFFYMKNFTRE